MEQESQHWSFDKRINLSHIFTTAAMLISLFVWGNKMDQRVTTLEAQTTANKEVVTRLDARLDRIEDKLDRIIEAAATKHQHE